MSEPAAMAGHAAAAVMAGWDALDRGEWDAAHRAFSRAFSAGAGARALEGLAWAAWWRSDAPALFPAREAAFRAYRDAGDAVAAARVATWLACDHEDFRGEHAVANGWRRRARRLLTEAPVSPEHGWLEFHEGAYALEAEEDATTARARAEEAAAIGRALGLPDLEFVALALEGLALVTGGEVQSGMRRLDEAGVAATSGEMRDRIAVAWTLCFLIMACERVRDFDRTAQWCHRLEEVSARIAFDLGVGVCRVHYGGVLLLHGDWARAEEELTAAAENLARNRPAAVVVAEARLGELRRRQGRLAEAAELLARAEPYPLALLGQAALALDTGQVRRAADITADLLDAVPGPSAAQRAGALELHARALALLGDIPAAAAAAAELDGIAGAIGTAPLEAMSRGADAAVAAAEGDLGRARRGLERAAALHDRTGLPYEAGAARTELARVLARLGRTEAAARLARRTARQLRELGALAAAELAERLPAGDARRGRVATPVGRLSPREAQVLGLVAEGLTDREIGDQLSISAHTVHRHVSNILGKLRVPSRTAAAALAGRHGLATPPAETPPRTGPLP
jgi:LuxR family transcriptional regulator, maltose regulon positive regulatory protein